MYVRTFRPHVSSRPIYSFPERFVQHFSKEISTQELCIGELQFREKTSDHENHHRLGKLRFLKDTFVITLRETASNCNKCSLTSPRLQNPIISWVCLSKTRSCWICIMSKSKSTYGIAGIFSQVQIFVEDHAKNISRFKFL